MDNAKTSQTYKTKPHTIVLSRRLFVLFEMILNILFQHFCFVIYMQIHAKSQNLKTKLVNVRGVKR